MRALLATGEVARYEDLAGRKGDGGGKVKGNEGKGGGAGNEGDKVGVGEVKDAFGAVNGGGEGSWNSGSRGGSRGVSGDGGEGASGEGWVEEALAPFNGLVARAWYEG